MHLSKKTRLVLSVALLIIGISLGIGAVIWANNLDHNVYDYDDLSYREFTVQSIKKTVGKYARYEIYTNEEQAPLVIGKMGFAATNQQEMDLVKQGDKILCYLTTPPKKSYSYEVIDLRTESKIVLSLEDYNTREVADQKIGCILIGVLSIVFLHLPLYDIVKAKNKRYSG